jgi:DNA polymerase-3 subunit chi
VPSAFESLFSRYERVIEVVSRDEAERARARSRFKAYRERGFQPTTFDGHQ